MDALVHAYSESIDYYRGHGKTWRGLTRRDYMKFKREDDPTYRSIERVLGSWKAFTNLIPEDEGFRPRPGHHGWDSLTKERFYQILVDIGHLFDKSPWRVTTYDYDRYRKDNPNVRSRQMYVALMGVDSWQDAVTYLRVAVENGEVKEEIIAQN